MLQASLSTGSISSEIVQSHGSEIPGGHQRDILDSRGEPVFGKTALEILENAPNWNGISA